MNYGLKYTIPFETISGVKCEIRIEEKGYSGEAIELIGGELPVNIQHDALDFIAPVRASSATVSVFGSSYLQDLYASDPQGVRIRLMVGGDLRWLGFLIPDTFSQDFSSPKFVYDLECVDAFSTLKYKEFDLEDDFVSFWEIIDRARTLAGYEDVYYTNSVKSETADYFSCRIATANFFDELGEAMSYYEVLEEIAKYAGCCWVPFEGDLYFLDYQAIRSGYTSHTKVTGIDSIEIDLQDLKNVENYKATGAKLSRIAGKNKAVVNCSLYEIESVLPDLEDSLSLGLGKSTVGWRKDSKTPYHYIVTVPGMIKGDRVSTLYNGIDKGRSSFTYVVRYTDDSVPNKLNFGTELRVMYYANKAQHDAGNYLTSNDAVLTIKSDKDVIVHQKVYLSFSCEMMANMEGTSVSSGYKQPESADTGLLMVEPWSTAFSDVKWPIKLRLKIGEYYYNGNSWAKTPATFTANFPIKEDEKKYGRYLTIEDTNDYTLGIGNLAGHIIKPPPTTIIGELELTVYAPRPNDFNQSPSGDYGVRYAFIKDIMLDYAIQDLEGVYDPHSGEKEDVIYENIVSEEFIEKADEIDLRICTNVDGKMAYSSILEGDVFLENIRTDVFGTGVAEEILLQRITSLFAKPRYVIDPTLSNDFKPYTKFTEAHLGKQFLVAGGDEDIKRERMRYNLIEIL